MLFKVKVSIINVVFQYLLIPLNVALIVWMGLMNHAFVYPTAVPTSIALRSRGNRQFNILYVLLCISSIVIGVTNVFIVYCALTSDKYKRQMKRFRDISSFPCCPSVPMYRFYGLIVLLFLGSYGAIGSMAFRDIFAQKAYKDSCDGAALMAEIMIVPDFPGFNGHPDAPIYDASSSIRFYKYDKYQYTMDLIRAYNQSLGFDNYGRTRSAANISSEGTLDLALRMAETHTEGDVAGGIEYFNGTKLTEYQQKGKRMHVPGPIGNVHYDLYNSTFDITFANTSAPGFPVNKRSGNFSSSPSGLFMSGLRLEQSDDNLIWRFTDHVCLPPRVRLKQKYHFNDDIYGSIAYDCRYYRMCALKMDDASDREDKKAWWEWVDDIWAVSVGLVAWEFENYSSCCLRNE